MATSPTCPGVYIQELQGSSHPITGVPTSIAAFVGYTKSGIDNRAQEISGFGDFERLYGGLATNSELSYAVQQFFQNGGAQAFVVRTPGTSTGASAANVVFEGLAFEAMSSGAAANGALLIDVDYIGLNPGGAAGDPKTFNLTVTDLAGGTTEHFPSVTLDNTVSNWVQAVINDPDNGSQLINMVTPTASQLASITGLANIAQTGLTGTAVTPCSIAAAVCGTTAATGHVAISSGSADVAGSDTLFTSELLSGQWITFGSDATSTPYRILAIGSDASLTLTQNYAGVSAASSAMAVANSTATQDYGLALSTIQPATVPAGLPITVKVIAKNSVLPTTLDGLATQIQQAINSVLAVQMPGAMVQVSVTPLPATPAVQALRINALLPANPDAVISIGDPAAAASLAPSGAFLGLGGTANVAHYALGTGNAARGQQTTSAKGSDGGLPATTDIIGDQAAFSGIYALMKVDLFNLLCIPDATRASAGDPAAPDPGVNANAIYSAAIALCDQRRAFMLLDPPPDVTSVAGAVDWKSSQLAVVDPNGAAFFPRLCLSDPLDKDQLRTFAPCGVVAGVYVSTDGSHGVWKAPAGTGAVLNGVTSMGCQLSDQENDVLNPLGLNCFRTFPVYGAVLWGARTLVGADAMASQWKYVPVRRTALFIEESLYRGTQWVAFEPNDEPLWASIRLDVGAFMQNLFLKGGFQGSTPAQAYFVKCGSDTTTQTDIDHGIVNILVGFAPLKPAEFVVIQIGQITAQAT